MDKKLNLIVFVFEKLSVFSLIALAISLGRDLFIYSQTLYMTAVAVSFASAYSAFKIAHLGSAESAGMQGCQSSQNTFSTLSLARMSVEIFNNIILSIVLFAPILLVLLFFSPVLSSLGISENVAVFGIITYCFVELLLGNVLQYFRFSQDISPSYLLRLIISFARAIALIFAIIWGDLSKFFLIFSGFGAVILVLLLLHFSYEKWCFRSLFKINFSREVSKFIIFGLGGCAATAIVGFDRYYLAGSALTATALEDFARLKFFLGFVVLIVPFVGYWLAPSFMKAREQRLLVHVLNKFIMLLSVHITTVSLVLLNIFIFLISLEKSGFGSIEALAVVAFSSISTVFSLMSSAWYNLYPKAFLTAFLALLFIFTIILVVDLDYLVSLHIATFIFCACSVIMIVVIGNKIAFKSILLMSSCAILTLAPIFVCSILGYDSSVLLVLTITFFILSSFLEISTRLLTVRMLFNGGVL